MYRYGTTFDTFCDVENKNKNNPSGPPTAHRGNRSKRCGRYCKQSIYPFCRCRKEQEYIGCGVRNLSCEENLTRTYRDENALTNNCTRRRWRTTKSTQRIYCVGFYRMCGSFVDNVWELSIWSISLTRNLVNKKRRGPGEAQFRICTLISPLGRQPCRVHFCFRFCPR